MTTLATSLATLPDRQPQRIAVKVRPTAERSIRQGHPWVFDGSIVKQSEDGAPGDLAIIFDQKKNKFLALGLLDPASPIRVKVLQANEPATLDAVWFSEKIAAAFAKREPLLYPLPKAGGLNHPLSEGDTATNSYRLLHGENDGLPSLVADVYAQVLVVKIYSAIWLPWLRLVLPLILEKSNCETLVLRLSRNLQADKSHGLADGQILHGDLPSEEVIFREHGLHFSANVVRGHKTGFFLDHRHNRLRCGNLAAGRTVLDVFSYAGGFTVHALAGGATEVTSLDISAQALAMGKQNVALNFAETTHHTLAADAFEAMEKLFLENKTFGLVIVDPPSFAKQASEVERALRSYGRLARLAARLVEPGGVLMLASCSSRVSADDFFGKMEGELASSGRAVSLLEKTFHDVDHPIGFPEGAYLKAGYWQV